VYDVIVDVDVISLSITSSWKDNEYACDGDHIPVRRVSSSDSVLLEQKDFSKLV